MYIVNICLEKKSRISVGVKLGEFSRPSPLHVSLVLPVAVALTLFTLYITLVETYLPI